MPDTQRSERVDVRLRQAFEAGELPKDLLVCGPAGTGKTWAILAFLHLLLADCEGLRVLVCRQTRRSLTDSVLVTYEQEILPADGMEFLALGATRDHRSRYLYPGGSELVVGGLDRPDKILSTSWDVIYVNEAIEVEEAAWDTLSTRLNRPGRPTWLGHLIGDTNPGDPSHWLRKRVDEGRTVLWDTGHEANPALHDGDEWTPAGRQYQETLDRLRGARRKRLRDGLWAAGEGQWFGSFDPDRHVSPDADFDCRYPVHLAVDTGVHTGAVLYQIRDMADGPAVTVFADYYSYDVAAEQNALSILGLCAERCGGRYDVGRLDPAGGARSGFGAQTIDSEFRRVGLTLEPWLKYPGCVLAGLNLLGSFLDSGRLTVHPRCERTVNALLNYKRKQRQNQFIDEPEDPQHPHEELIDALRSSLLDRYPEGRRPKPSFRQVSPHRAFY